MLLVFPVEDKPSWQRPPVVCVALILLNLLLYGLFAQRDEAIHWQAAEAYAEAPLLDREWPLYLDYLEETDPEAWTDLSGTPRKHRMDAALGTLLYDRGFDRWLRATDDPRAVTLRADAKWLAAREQVETLRNDLSMYRHGTTPGDLHADDLFTAMFMHGSWDHVIGNMLFLALFGLALEARLGHLRLLLLYLLTGIAADAAHILSDPDSMVPVVGASGAVSGLMGMYAGVYGFRKREFLLMIGPWLGSARLPALVVFPFWLGWEVISALRGGGNVAYWAHAGGLVAGLLLVQPFLRRAAAAEAAIATAAAPGALPALSPHLLQLAESGQFEKAVAACEAKIERGSSDRALWTFYLDNAARAGRDTLRRAAGRLLATLNAPAPDYTLATQGYLQLKELRFDPQQLPPPHRLLLCELQMRMSRHDEALLTLQGLIDSGWRHPRLQRTALALATQLPDAQAAARLRERATSLAPPASGQ